MDEAEREGVLQNYRLAFRADTLVNWCPELGTVLANDEVKDGLSVRGGYPVVQKRMKQWLLRVTAYAQRMLDGLDTLEWSDSLKEIQRNWIGRSEGAQIFFGLKGFDEKLEVFTTRADTIFGATFMVLAPEHALVGKIAAPEQREAVERYIEETKKRSERERMADTKRVSGQFTGAYAINPFNGTEIPIYISDYVLAGYGTGAIMAVPAHDSRDYAFAKHFDLPIIPVVEGGDLSVASYDAKAGRMINSDFLTGMDVKEAIPAMIAEVERRGFGAAGSTTPSRRDFQPPAVLGANRSRFTTRTTSPARSPRTACRSSFPRSRTSVRRPRASRRWRASRDGRRPKGIRTS